MKRIDVLVIFSTLLFFIFLTSCEKRSVTPGETDWDAITELIFDYPDIFDLGFYDIDPDTLFYREITQSNGDIEEGWFYEADSTHFFDYITLNWGDSLKGSFHYRFNGKSYQKPIYSVALSNAYFEKWGDNYDPYRGWILMQFSGTVINSVGGTKQLYTLDIVSDGVEKTLSEPVLLQLVKKDSTLTFGKDKPVTFTIDVPLSDTSDFFFLYVKEGEAYQKIPFTSNGDGTFSASWTVTSDPDPSRRYYHAIVDMISRESVTDTTEEYDSKAWGIIYKIE